MVQLERSGEIACLRLLPNRSATWRQTQWAIMLLGGVTLTIATAWSILGFWLILPFAGLEVALLYWLGYRVCSATYHQQVVLFSRDEIEVQWGHRFPKKRWVFKRSDVELEVVRPHHSLSPHTLFLRDEKQVVPVADKLNQGDVDEVLSCFGTERLPMRFSGRTVIFAAEPPAADG